MPRDGVSQARAQHHELVLPLVFGRARGPAHRVVEPPQLALVPESISRMRLTTTCAWLSRYRLSPISLSRSISGGPSDGPDLPGHHAGHRDGPRHAADHPGLRAAACFRDFWFPALVPC